MVPASSPIIVWGIVINKLYIAESALKCHRRFQGFENSSETEKYLFHKPRSCGDNDRAYDLQFNIASCQRSSRRKSVQYCPNNINIFCIKLGGGQDGLGRGLKKF